MLMTDAWLQKLDIIISRQHDFVNNKTVSNISRQFTVKFELQMRSKIFEHRKILSAENHSFLCFYGSEKSK